MSSDHNVTVDYSVTVKYAFDDEDGHGEGSGQSPPADNNSITITIRYQPAESTDTIDGDQGASTGQQLLGEDDGLTFTLDQGVFLEGHTAAWDTIVPWLDELGVPLPLQPSTVDAIFDSAFPVMNVGRKPSVMDVFIKPACSFDDCVDDNDIDLDSEDDLEDYYYYYDGVLDDDQMEVDVVEPAGKEAVERLEKVIAEFDEGRCVVCIENFEVGSCLTMLPCFHVYHDECIVKWLDRKNFCPLCRKRLPC